MERAALFSAGSDEPDIGKDDVELTWKTTQKDLDMVAPAAEMILRRGGISAHTHSDTPVNLLSEDQIQLPTECLDKNTKEAGLFLIHRFACKNKLLGLSEEDLKDAALIEMPESLRAKLKTGTSVTVKRMSCKPPAAASTPVKQEKKRLASVKTKSKVIDCMSSSKNTCQAILKPDGKKADTFKAKGVKDALITLLSNGNGGEACEKEGLITLNTKDIHFGITSKVGLATIELAGVKFKVAPNTGFEYLQYIQNGIMKKILRSCPQLRHMVLVEEKYSFTPDSMKAATREQRKPKDDKATIGHLKLASELVSMNTFDHKSVIATAEGRKVVSEFLAENLDKVDIKEDVSIYVDSELHMKEKECICEGACVCDKHPFAVPIQGIFTRATGFQEICPISNIKQRKGEAEMAQLDWMIDMLPTLKPGETVMSYVTSGDIDAVVLHMFMVSHMWPRESDGTFCHPVFVVLQKPNKCKDVYNITEIVRRIENVHGKHSAMNVALVLSMGGNDFLPKFFNITHGKLLTTVINENVLGGLFELCFEESGKCLSGFLRKEVYLRVIKRLYCPAIYDSEKLTFDEVRQYSVGMTKDGFRNPRLWMPPEEALNILVDMVNWQLAYMLTAGDHARLLPVHLGPSIFTSVSDTLKVTNPSEVCVILKENLAKSLRVAKSKGVKRVKDDTPQKGERRKIERNV